MERILYIFIFIVGLTYQLSSQITFNKRLHFDFPAAVLTGLHPTDSCYYATGIIADSMPPNYQTSNVFAKFDLNGDVEFAKTLISQERTHECWHNTLYALAEHQFVVSGYSIEDSFVMRIMYILFDDQGDTLDLKTFISPNFPEFDYNRPDAFAPTPDGGFLFACWTRVSDLPNDDIYLFKVDSLGNQQWSQFYGTNYWEFPNSMIIKDNGNAIIGGRRANRNLQTSNYDFQTWIFEVDTSGNLLWEYLSPIDVLRDGANDMVLLDDGSLVVVSGIGTEIPRPSVNTVYFDKYIFKLSPELDIFWEKTFYSPIPSGTVYSNKMLAFSDGSGFLIAGSELLNPDDPEIDYSIPGWISKVSPQGDSLWNREFLFLNQKTNKHTIYDLKETPDGGFILCGEAFDRSYTDTTVQQAWLLKVDSEGCLVPNCHVSTQELPQNSLQFSLYPNPASDFLNILFKGKATAQLRLLNANGQIIQEVEQVQGEVTYILPVWDLVSGAYWVQVLVEGKVVKQEQVIILH